METEFTKQGHDEFFEVRVAGLLLKVESDVEKDGIAHPFPWVLNKALCLAVWLEGEDIGSRGSLGVLTIPRCLPRVMVLTRSVHGKMEHSFVFLYDVIKFFIKDLFRGYQIKGSASFRVTRNSNLYGAEDLGNLLDTVEAVVHNPRKGNVVRLEIEDDAPIRIYRALQENFDLASELIFSVSGPVNLNRLTGLYQMIPLPNLKFPPHFPRTLQGDLEGPQFFAKMREDDLLLHHPFDSFDPVTNFIRSAARDPEVLCIKQTLYRTSAESPIMYALLEAAELGKEVTANFPWYFGVSLELFANMRMSELAITIQKPPSITLISVYSQPIQKSPAKF